jgi:hypothetical protein
MESAVQQDGAAVGDVVAGYADEHRPLAAYSVLTASFGAALAGAVLEAARRDKLPGQIGYGDIVLTGVATHKLSRLIGKDRVTSFLRAPFTRYQEPAGHGELEEEPRGTGLRLALGELLVCPYCLGQWVAGGLVGGLVFAPRATRVVTGMYTALTISDFLQMAYKAAEERSG